MASSRSSDRVRTWEQIKGDFLQSCRILSLERRAWEDTAMWYHIGMNRTWGAGKVCLFADWKWEDASRFIGKGKEDFLFVWFWFFLSVFFFLWCRAVGFCDLPLVMHGTEIFTILCCESWLLFLHLLWDVISHRAMHSETIFKKIYFHNILDGIFNLFF